MEHFETTLQERESPTTAGRREQPRRRRSADRAGAAMVCALLALVVSLAAFWMAFPRTESEPEPEPAAEPIIPTVAAEPEHYITYRSYQLPIEEELAVNAWKQEAFLTDETGRIGYSTPELTAIPGIDVSTHQQEIDWKQVAESGIRFAMIRAGYRGYGPEGRLVIDEYFHANMKGALEAGLDVGVYFFSQATNVWEAEEEANMLLDELRGYPLTYPVVFDWERIHRDSARTDPVPGKTVTLMAQAFCGLIKEAGYLPGIYFNQDLAYLELDLERLDENVFWLAEYDSTPEFYYHFDLWQYSSKGTVPGIKGAVDLNLSFRDFGAETTD